MIRAAVTSLLMIGALAGCDENRAAAGGSGAAGTMPELPAILVTHDDPPIGSALNHRVVRASREVAVRLEPRWGDVQPRILTVAPENRDRLGAELRKALPADWQVEPLDGVAPKGTRLYGFSSGDRFFAALLVEPEGAPVTPVVILRNRKLLDMTKG